MPASRPRRVQVARGQGTHGKPLRDRHQQLDNYPANFALCRIMKRHSMPADPSEWPRPQPVSGGWVIEWKCPVCALEVTVYYTRWGFREDRTPYRKYEDGYLLEQGGRMTDAENAALFMRLAGGQGYGRAQEESDEQA